METIYHGHSIESGVYKIYNKSNGRIYIGSAKRFKERFSGHLNSLKQNKHKNKYLQNDFNKCGSESFIFEVIEVVNGPKEERTKKEQSYLNRYFDKQIQCYNICEKVDIPNDSTGFKHSIETRLLISESSRKRWKDPEYKKLISNKLKGKKKQTFTKEHKQNIGLSSKGRKMSDKNKQKLSNRMKDNKLSLGRDPWNKGKKCSDKQKQLISKANKGRSHTKETIEKISQNSAVKRKILAINLQTKEEYRFNSIIETSKILNKNLRNIFRILKGERNSKFWSFEYQP